MQSLIFNFSQMVNFCQRGKSRKWLAYLMKNLGCHTIKIECILMPGLHTAMEIQSRAAVLPVTNHLLGRINVRRAQTLYNKALV